MSKFNVNDIVECTNAASSNSLLKQYQFYTVESTAGSGAMETVVLKGVMGSWNVDRFRITAPAPKPSPAPAPSFVTDPVFYVGDTVECIDDGGISRTRTPTLVKGNSYTVSNYIPARPPRSPQGSVEVDGNTFGWKSSRFKLLKAAIAGSVGAAQWSPAKPAPAAVPTTAPAGSVPAQGFPQAASPLPTVVSHPPFSVGDIVESWTSHIPPGLPGGPAIMPGDIGTVTAVDVGHSCLTVCHSKGTFVVRWCHYINATKGVFCNNIAAGDEAYYAGPTRGRLRNNNLYLVGAVTSSDVYLTFTGVSGAADHIEIMGPSECMLCNPAINNWARQRFGVTTAPPPVAAPTPAPAPQHPKPKPTVSKDVQEWMKQAAKEALSPWQPILSLAEDKILLNYRAGDVVADAPIVQGAKVVVVKDYTLNPGTRNARTLIKKGEQYVVKSLRKDMFGIVWITLDAPYSLQIPSTTYDINLRPEPTGYLAVAKDLPAKPAWVTEAAKAITCCYTNNEEKAAEWIRDEFVKFHEEVPV